MKLEEYFNKKRRLIDKELEKLLPPESERPFAIHKAMRYAVRGGKRIRPILCLLSAEASGKDIKKALKTACAIEMIHTYSLIHDDLPAMDNDDYRRGRPTCHKKFGEANAILAGDALLTLAFNVLSGATADAALNARISEAVSGACGTFGMIGGQAADIMPGDKDLMALEYININKTGALIAASCKAGAISSGAKNKDINALFAFGERIGLVFQIVDDILDSEGFAKFLGPKRAYEYAAELTQKAKMSLRYFGKRSAPLLDTADFILNRKY